MIAYRPIFRALGLALALAWSPASSAATGSELPLPREGWASWQIPAATDVPAWCCFGDRRSGMPAIPQTCQLDGRDHGYGNGERRETTTEMRIYARFHDGKLERVRALAASCPVATDTVIQELGNVSVDASAGWLTGVIANDATKGARARRLDMDAMAALATHRGAGARDALSAIARNDADIEHRKDALFWLTQVRGAEGAAVVTPFMFDDADARVREHAAFAVAQSRAVPTASLLIRQASEDRNAQVRSRAWFWLAQTGVGETETAIRAALKREADAGVREQAVFALSRLPTERAVRALVAVAEDQSLSRNERKQAIFWLGEQKSDFALQYLDRLLTAKTADR